MQVYRNCCFHEIIEILNNKNFNNVGSFFKEDPNINTFKYLENIRYMHFFRNEYSVLHKDTSPGRFICTYNIPYSILEEYFGYGYYKDFINLKNKIKVEEYAIPSDKMKFEYLISADELTSYVDFEDLIDADIFTYTRNNYRWNIWK